MRHFFLILILFSSSLLLSQEEKISIDFKVDAYELDGVARKKLDKIVSNDRARSIKIIGYSDTTGSANYNEKLSVLRAKSVQNYLIDRGVDTTNFKGLIGKGESTKGSSLAENRIVEVLFKVLPAESKLTIENEKVDVSVNRKLQQVKNDSSEESFDHRSVTRDGELNQKTIESLEVGEILNIGGIEFQPGRHILTKRSYKSVDKLIKVMKENSGLKIEIQGHICCNTDGDGMDKDTGTRNLSENRAIQIYMELVKAGVSKDRMTYKGYGPFRKLVKEVDDASRQRNRRVSIQILEK